MKTLVSALGGLMLGVVGAGLGRAGFAALDGAGYAPDKGPARSFVADSFLVLGCIPGALTGAYVGAKLVHGTPVIEKK